MAIVPPGPFRWEKRDSGPKRAAACLIGDLNQTEWQFNGHPRAVRLSGVSGPELEFF